MAFCKLESGGIDGGKGQGGNNGRQKIDAVSGGGADGQARHQVREHGVEGKAGRMGDAEVCGYQLKFTVIGGKDVRGKGERVEDEEGRRR